MQIANLIINFLCHFNRDKGNWNIPVRGKSDELKLAVKLIYFMIGINDLSEEELNQRKEEYKNKASEMLDDEEIKNIFLINGQTATNVIIKEL